MSFVFCFFIGLYFGLLFGCLMYKHRDKLFGKRPSDVFEESIVKNLLHIGKIPAFNKMIVSKTGMKVMPKVCADCERYKMVNCSYPFYRLGKILKTATWVKHAKDYRCPLIEIKED